MKSLLAGLCLCFASVTSAVAQTDFDPRHNQIEIVVPYPPGGATDKWARVVNEIFTDLGWKSIVMNRPGADTVIGSNYVANSKPNGYTLYVGGNGFLDSNLAFKNKPQGMTYTENSFEPIISLGAGTAVLAVSNTVPVNTYDEFKAYVKANPNKFNLGFWNSYTANVFYTWAQKEGLSKPNIAFYRGSAPMTMDLVGGHLSFAFDTFTAIDPFYESGKVKIIAVLDAKGEAIVKKKYPKINLFNIGKKYPDVDVPIWYGLYAPAGTPKSTVYYINAELNQAFSNPKYTRLVEALHIANFGGVPEDQRRTQQRVLSIMRKTAKTVE
jgi:tripartite-type tricarboxylate transporter receptor subunit TctC